MTAGSGGQLFDGFGDCLASGVELGAVSGVDSGVQGGYVVRYGEQFVIWNQLFQHGEILVILYAVTQICQPGGGKYSAVTVGVKEVAVSHPSGPAASEMPPLDEINRMIIFQMPGRNNSLEGIGGGFLRKTRHVDLENWVYGNFVLVLVLQGSGKYVDASGHEYLLTPGNIYVRLPDIMHSTCVDSDSGYVECYLECGPRLYASLQAMGFLPVSPPVHRIEWPDTDLPRKIWHWCWNLNSSAEPDMPVRVAELVSMLGEFKRSCLSDQTGLLHQDIIDIACQELGENFPLAFSLPEFCRRHSIDYENFRKLFRSRTGFSPWDYRLHRRLETARLLLNTRTLTIGEISAQLGYNSPYEFSAQFKRRFGISPRQYRQNLML